MRSEERFSRNAETDLVCRLLLEKKKTTPLLWAPSAWEAFLCMYLPSFSVGLLSVCTRWCLKLSSQSHVTMATPHFCTVFFSSYASLRYLHSFPTRRSSDLN